MVAGEILWCVTGIDVLTSDVATSKAKAGPGMVVADAFQDRVSQIVEWLFVEKYS